MVVISLTKLINYELNMIKTNDNKIFKTKSPQNKSIFYLCFQTIKTK